MKEWILQIEPCNVSGVILRTMRWCIFNRKSFSHSVLKALGCECVCVHSCVYQRKSKSEKERRKRREKCDHVNFPFFFNSFICECICKSLCMHIVSMCLCGCVCLCGSELYENVWFSCVKQLNRIRCTCAFKQQTSVLVYL